MPVKFWFLVGLGDVTSRLHNEVVSSQRKKSTWFNRSCAHFIPNARPHPCLCGETEMLPFFKNISETKALLAEKEINYTNLTSCLSDISRNSVFHLNLPTLTATLCRRLSPTAWSELQGRASPLEMITCTFNPGAPPCKHCTWRGWWVHGTAVA